MNTRCVKCQTLSLTVALAAPDCYQRELAKLMEHRRTCAVYHAAQPERYQLTRALRQPCQAHQFTRGVCDVCGMVRVKEGKK